MLVCSVRRTLHCLHVVPMRTRGPSRALDLSAGDARRATHRHGGAGSTGDALSVRSLTSGTHRTFLGQIWWVTQEVRICLLMITQLSWESVRAASHEQPFERAFQVAQRLPISPQCRRCRCDPWVRKIPWRKKNGNTLWDSCLGNPLDRGPWWDTVHGVAEDLDETWWLNNSTALWKSTQDSVTQYLKKLKRF